MVPEGWTVCKLEEMALIERGKFSARPRNDPRYFGGHMPFVQTGDVTSAGTYLMSYTQTLNDEGIDVSKVFPRETILITIAANIGDTAITTFDVACPDSIVAIQVHKNKADVYWLKKYLETKKEDLDSQSTQNAQKNINLQVLKPLLILTPSLPEQKKIAQILSTWDKAITVTEKLLANSQQQKKALMQQLLTGKKRLLDKNGVRFGGEWKSYELGDWIREYSEKSVSSDQYEVLTSSRGGLVKQSEYFADSRIGQRDNIGFNIIPPGYITYRSRSDDGQFFFNRNEFSFTGIISIYYPVFHFPDGDSTFFLNYLNRSSSKFSGYSVGTSQKVLSLNALKSFKAKLPREPLVKSKNLA